MGPEDAGNLAAVPPVGLQLKATFTERKTVEKRASSSEICPSTPTTKLQKTDNIMLYHI